MKAKARKSAPPVCRKPLRPAYACGCRPGFFLCAAAGRLWDEAGVLYHAREYAAEKQRYAEYDRHFSEQTPVERS